MEVSEFSLRLFQLIRGHCDDASFRDTDLVDLQESVPQKLTEMTYEKLELLGTWRIGDDIPDRQIIIDTLISNLLAPGVGTHKGHVKMDMTV
jgi:hypothetical protein